MGQNWGQARVQVKGLREEIFEGLSADRPIKSIYDDLAAKNRVSVTYRAFCACVSRLCDSSKKPAPGSRGQGRVEVVALRSGIRAALATGQTLKAVYRELKAEGRVSVTYQAFHKNVRKFCVSHKLRTSGPLSAVSSPQPSPPTSQSSASPSPAPRSSPRPPPTPAPVEAFTEERVRREPVFKRNESITIEELI